MPPLSAPLIDFNNPLYCPDVSAHQYMSSIRLFQASVADASKFPYFHRMCNAFLANKFEDSPESLPLHLMKGQLLPQYLSVGIKDPSFIKDRDDNTSVFVSTAARNIKRESDGPSSDSSKVLLKRPQKRIKRSSSRVDMSFVLSAKAERLRFSDKMAQLPSSDVHTDSQHHKRFAAEEMFWPEGQSESFETIGLLKPDYQACLETGKEAQEDSRLLELESPKYISALLEHLEILLPGIRLRNQLDSATATHQDIVHLLGTKGHLNPETLSLFRYTHIRTLTLTESIVDADGLNLLRYDTLKVLKDPNGFLSLRSIVLSDAPLSDDDLSCLNCLQSLESLFLDDTQIGDIAVMHLIALRESLAHLELSWNERITDNAIPTLCSLSNIRFLSLKGTTITMKGLRKLACSAKERDKKISIILPSECEVYLCNYHEEYEINLASPLVHDPNACRTLSKTALIENLAAHAARNPRITTEGTKPDLERKLTKLLERRKKDMIVQGFMLQGFA